MEELEPRLLFSADLPGVLAQSGLLGADPDTTPPAIVAMVDAPAVGAAIGQQQQTPAEAGFSLSQPRAGTVPQKELVFVDAGAPNYQQLINDLLKAQAQGRPIEVVVLESGRDGVEQITEALEERRDLGAVHIVSHGSDGSLALGNGRLSAYNLESYRDAIKSWQASLTEGADLLIYGCDFAGSAQGREMVETLSALTGADVAASNDTTGAASLGGDWELEYQAGDIEAQIAFSGELQETWQGSLTTYIVDNAGNSGTGTLREAITLANANAGFDNIFFDLGNGVQTINIATAMVGITDAVNIDATRNSAGVVDPDFIALGRPVVEIDGNGVGGNGLTLGAGSDGSTIRGLIINTFGGHGIEMTSSFNTIAGNWIGTDQAGTGDAGNLGQGIYDTGNGNTIGGYTDADRNVISGNDSGGIWLDEAINTLIVGNYIGTDFDGSGGVGNTNNGIDIDEDGVTPAGTIIGGTAAGARNVISGNTGRGIALNAGNVVIQGNYIGTNATATAVIGNGQHGIAMDGADNRIKDHGHTPEILAVR